MLSYVAHLGNACFLWGPRLFMLRVSKTYLVNCTSSIPYAARKGTYKTYGSFPRFTQPPASLLEWFEDYLDDEEVS